ncbi:MULTISPECIES: heptaprenyl diphosphate synthase component 1 [Bacillaceae]|uniref:Heptaprenyl diphosphate synthase component 1 n=1 Tax=Evansella alkalicola TaxID=745819 RepID=A0ABS6JZD8_9BACI|nr:MULTISPECIES: heptaprenyl diphosphate synthase component 1 [Bacillaceae]MBU9723956.1 heptaprenyl diphosphate synthase component 1 [Bacillus alkalicola]
MTSIYNPDKELNNIIEKFYDYIKHPFIQKYIDVPVIDKDKVSLLYYMLKAKEVSPSYLRQCMITTTLVQSALDTHEGVSVKTNLSETMNKRRQLTVLAGDYYSSLYYFFLAKENDISLIRVLAQSIQEINEAKMNVYKSKEKYGATSLEDVRSIDSSLFKNVATLLEMPEWAKAHVELLFFKRLLVERKHFFERGKKGHVAQLLLDQLKVEGDLNRDLIEQFDLNIEKTKDKLIKIAHESNPLRTYLMSRIQDLIQENRYDEHYVVEEG